MHPGKNRARYHATIRLSFHALIRSFKSWMYLSLRNQRWRCQRLSTSRHHHYHSSNNWRHNHRGQRQMTSVRSVVTFSLDPLSFDIFNLNSQALEVWFASAIHNFKWLNWLELQKFLNFRPDIETKFLISNYWQPWQKYEIREFRLYI